MTLRNNSKDKSCVTQLSQELLIEVKGLTKEKNPAIAQRLGIDPATIWGVEQGKRNASNQLYTGLRLLLSTLRMAQRIEDLEQRLTSIQSMYPGMVIPELAINETKGKYTVNSNADDLKDLSKVKEISERYYPRQKKKQ